MRERPSGSFTSICHIGEEPRSQCSRLVEAVHDQWRLPVSSPGNASPLWEGTHSRYDVAPLETAQRTEGEEQVNLGPIRQRDPFSLRLGACFGF